MVQSGLTPFEALQTATVNPARWAGKDGAEGIIAEGAKADLVLLSQNPLDDITATRLVEGVITNGQWLANDRLEAMLESCKQPNNPEQRSR